MVLHVLLSGGNFTSRLNSKRVTGPDGAPGRTNRRRSEVELQLRTILRRVSLGCPTSKHVLRVRQSQSSEIALLGFFYRDTTNLDVEVPLPLAIVPQTSVPTSSSLHEYYAAYELND